MVIGFDGGPEAKLLVDADTGAIIDANEAAMAFYGFDKPSLQAREVWDLHVRSREEVARDMARAIAGDQIHFRFEQVLASGSTKEVETCMIPVEVEGCQYLYTVAVDRGERHETEEELRRIRAALDGCSEAVLMQDLQGKVMYFNMAFGALLGHAKGKTDEVHFAAHWVDETILERALAHVLDGENWEGEAEMISGQGVVFPVLARATRVMNAESACEGTLFILTDMTKRKEMETELLQAQKLKSAGQLAAGVAHEINTPLQYLGDNARFVRDGVIDLTDIIAKYHAAIEAAKSGTLTEAGIGVLEDAAADIEVDYLADEIPKALDQSLEGISQVIRVVRALREFTHPGTVNKTMTDVNKVVDNAVVVSRNVWKYTAELVLNLEPALPLVACFPGEIGEVLLNLIVNAALAIKEHPGRKSKEKGRITVSTAHDGGHVELRVGDTGGGIPPDIQERIFEPFFTTRGVGKGTGQGLAISRKVVVERHAGTLTFETEEGRGTTFIVRLPLEKGSNH